MKVMITLSIKLSLLFLIISVTNSNQSDNKCTVKVGRSKADLAKGLYIYDSGIVNPEWTANSNKHYIASGLDSFDYFYLLENKLSEHIDEYNFIVNSANKDDKFIKPEIVKDTVKSDETEILDNLNNNKYLFKSIQVKYNCALNSEGEAKMALNINLSDCPSFSIYWLKICAIPSKFFI